MTKWCGKAWERKSRSSVVNEFKKCGLNISVGGSENQEVNIEKIPSYQIPLDDDELKEEYTLHDDGDGDDYVENESGTVENIENIDICGMPAIQFTLAKCMKTQL